MSPLSPRPASRGFVLPVVLVVLVVMTTVVLFNIRRGAVDERLATNVRQFVTMETAATYALRYSEIMLTVSPPGRAALPGLPDPPNVVAAPPSNGPPAWRQWANWNITPVGLPNPLHATVVLAPDLLGLEVQRAERTPQLAEVPHHGRGAGCGCCPCPERIAHQPELKCPRPP